MSKRKRPCRESCAEQPSNKKQKLDWIALKESDLILSLCKSGLQRYLGKHCLRMSGKKIVFADGTKTHVHEDNNSKAACNIRSIFDDEDDHLQFVSILLSIEGSKMVKNLSVPSVISRIVAEYATETPYCEYRNCGKDVAASEIEYCSACRIPRALAYKCLDGHFSQWYRSCLWCAYRYPVCQRFICCDQICASPDKYRRVCEWCDDFFCCRSVWENCNITCQYCYNPSPYGSECDY